MNIEAILDERKRTHGEYRDHARYTQMIKHVVRFAFDERVQRSQSVLSEIACETLDMIAHKIGRILAGDPLEPDHWDDIAGYAKLVSDRIREDRFNPAIEEVMADELKAKLGNEFDA